MNTFTQILPQFKEIKLLHSDDFTDEIQTNCAYLLAESNSIAKFIDKIGKRYVHDNKVLNLYDFYTAYNLKFPTVPSTVSLMSPKRLIAMGIKSFDELLQKILDNAGENLPMAVFLSIEARTMEEMLKIKRDILQQFIFLRMYIPIIVSENFKAAKKTFDEILYSTPEEKTNITFIGTKKSGKSSLINAVLGEEYTPSSSELPTPNKISYLWSGSDKSSISVEYGDNQIYFSDASDVNEYLTREFRRANKTASALRPMQVCIPNFPADLRDFIITDTPGPNFAASQEHTAVTENTLKDIQHAIFIMNYSAHLTDDEILLFDKVYKVLNNKRRHQTMIVAVNRIDEMYAADVIKSYERFADYILKRLNALG
ncbi:MAG: dynamin family protein [Selenomonadaceae bacterium]|nr:dynamin family protein [Selenomonadaceae bacterium]